MMKFRSILLTIIVGSLYLFAFASAPDVPQPGASAPDFILKSQEGKDVSLKDFKGKWTVLYFYPKDFTSGCTVQAKNFQRDIAAYEKAGAVIVGVSFDDVNSHKEFCAKEGLSFKLLADTDGTVSKEFGSVMEGRNLSARNTFIIDPVGKIAKVYIKVNVQKHSEEVLASLAELQKK